ncbi:MAG: trimethylamine methyltransferase family protein [Pseudomonadales bacterium]
MKNRRAGRGKRLSNRGGKVLEQLPWQTLSNPYAPTAVLSEEQIEQIHEASLTILEEQGLVFLLEEARTLLAAAGAELDESNKLVKFDRELVLSSVAKAPATINFHARNSAHNLHIGGNHLAICSVASAPNCSDLEGGRRTGNQADFQNFIRLGQSLNIMHMFGGYPVEPIDLHPDSRHLDCIYDFLTLSDKAYVIYSLGRQRNIDALEMTRIGYGLSEAEFDETPCVSTIINANSPLTYDEPMLRGIIEMARCNQVSVITPFTLAGAMAPVTIAGALAQQNAEALAGIAFAQIVRPGSPVVYGGFTSNVDMKSGAPAFGTPEYMLAATAGGQLARRYGLPYRSSNANAANSVDAQAAYESVFSLWGAVSGHCNMLMHGLVG